MHESSLAKQLLDAVLAEMVSREGRVTQVKGWLAETEALNADSLQLHFGALSAGTVAEGAVLSLSLEHVAATCNGCGATYLPEHHLTLCPDCGSLDGVLQGKVGLGLSEITVRQGDPA